MRRRACAGWLAGSLLGRGVQAQERVWRIGILRPSAPPIASDTTWTGIPRALRDLGYVEGRNLVLEHRYASGNTDLLVPLARELAAARVDLVIAVSAGAVRGIGVDGGKVAVEIALGYPAESWCETQARHVEAVLLADPRVARCAHEEHLLAALARGTPPTEHLSGRWRRRGPPRCGRSPRRPRPCRRPGRGSPGRGTSLPRVRSACGRRRTGCV